MWKNYDKKNRDGQTIVCMTQQIDKLGDSKL